MKLDHIHLAPEDVFSVPNEPGRPETRTREFRVQFLDSSSGVIQYKEFSDELSREGWVTRLDTIDNFRHMVQGFLPTDWGYIKVPKGKDFLFTEEATRAQLCGQLNYFQAEAYYMETPDKKSVLVWANHMPYMYVRKTAWKLLVQRANQTGDDGMSGILYHDNQCLDLPILRMLRQMPVPGGNAE